MAPHQSPSTDILAGKQKMSSRQNQQSRQSLSPRTLHAAQENVSPGMQSKNWRHAVGDNPSQKHAAQQDNRRNFQQTLSQERSGKLSIPPLLQTQNPVLVPTTRTSSSVSAAGKGALVQPPRLHFQDPTQRPRSDGERVRASQQHQSLPQSQKPLYRFSSSAFPQQRPTEARESCPREHKPFALPNLPLQTIMLDSSADNGRKVSNQAQADSKPQPIVTKPNLHPPGLNPVSQGPRQAAWTSTRASWRSAKPSGLPMMTEQFFPVLPPMTVYEPMPLFWPPTVATPMMVGYWLRYTGIPCPSADAIHPLMMHVSDDTKTGTTFATPDGMMWIWHNLHDTTGPMDLGPDWIAVTAAPMRKIPNTSLRPQPPHRGQPGIFQSPELRDLFPNVPERIWQNSVLKDPIIAGMLTQMNQVFLTRDNAVFDILRVEVQRILRQIEQNKPRQQKQKQKQKAIAPVSTGIQPAFAATAKLPASTGGDIPQDGPKPFRLPPAPVPPKQSFGRTLVWDENDASG